MVGVGLISNLTLPETVEVGDPRHRHVLARESGREQETEKAQEVKVQ